MNLSKIYISLFILSAVPLAGAATLTISPRFNNPQCQTYEGKPQNAYCTRADVPQAQTRKESPFAKVVELIKKKGLKKLTLGTMTFSHREVATALCQAAKSGVTVEILIDAGSDMAAAEMATKCGAILYKVGTAEPKDDEAARGDLHHNKFLLAEGEEEATLVFSTGNFSNPGLSINHEIWTFVSSNSDSRFIEEHRCLIESVKNYVDDLAKFKKQLNTCRARIEKNESVIESLFIPADSTKLINLIDEKIKSSKRVLLASNRYSYDKITSAFATSESRDSRAIFDDDLYWGGVQPTPDYEKEALDAKKIQALEKTPARVRFTQTSFGAAQKMHSKFIVFDDIVVIGAGNYTYAGMTSNFENFYVIRDAETVKKFKDQFEYLWKLSTARREMPTDYVDYGSK